ncbi:hypothetical protein MMC29_003146 [Sticta canariensis]|nr:hypothetical protein [Sticta canariensis]
MALVQIDMKQVNKLHNDVKSSLAKIQDVANLLSSAPLTLNLIGQVRLLAFSKQTIHTNLRRPITEKYDYLKSETLAGCMQQLFNQATNSFREADMEMSAIVDLGPLMFGSDGCVTTILRILSEPRTAQRLLEPTMVELRGRLKECEEGANAIYESFDRTKNIAEELNVAVGNGITLMKTTEITADSEESAEQELERAKISAEIEERIKQTLEKSTDECTRELNQERARYKKRMKEGVKRRNEFKDIGLCSVLGVQSGVSTAFSAIIGVVRDTPKIALTSAQAIGALGGASVQFGNNQENHQPTPNVSQAVDPIFAEAARFYEYLSDLDQLISGDLLHTLREKDAEKDIIRCVENLKSLQASLKGCRSEQLPKVQNTLDTAIELGESIPSKTPTARLVAGPGNEWQELVAEWKTTSRALLLKGLEFNGAASVQPGMAFGQDLQSNSAETTGFLFSDSSNPNYKALQARRQAYLTTLKLSMEKGQESLRRNKEKSLESQKKVIELAGKIKVLEEEKVTFSLIQEVLRDSLDCITKLQHEIHNLVKYFRGFSNAIDIVANKQVENLLRAISAGIDCDPVGYKLAYGSALSRIIVDSLLSVRAQFSVALDSARLYVLISEKYINPCLRAMSGLEVGASHKEQNEQKNRLATVTAEASEMITQEITKQFEVLYQQVDGRIQEIVEESRSFNLPQLTYEQRQAITAGIEEATTQLDEGIKVKGNQEASLDKNVELDEI